MPTKFPLIDIEFHETKRAKLSLDSRPLKISQIETIIEIYEMVQSYLTWWAYERLKHRMND